jgi:hypothetical protein
MNPLQIKPNVPLKVALLDLEGTYDPDRETVTYQTLTGQQLTLPRPAVIKLNLLEPQPGEEVVITQIWSGKRWDKSDWTVALSPNSEKCRAKAEETPPELTEQFKASMEQAEPWKRATADPTPIHRPSRKQPAPEVQPRLFDQRGTGTNGPAPAAAPIPAPAILPAAARQRVGMIPANIATKEILQFIQADPNTANWSDQARQDLLSTILIAAYRAGHVGLWERQS